MAIPPIHVEGLDALRRDLRRVKDKDLDEEMRAIHRELAEEIIRRAKPPIDTGALDRSIRAAGTVRDAVGRVGSKSVPYAPPIHWGWPARGIPSRPFLQDAARQLERDIVDRYDREVARMLDRVIGKT